VTNAKGGGENGRDKNGGMEQETAVKEEERGAPAPAAAEDQRRGMGEEGGPLGSWEPAAADEKPADEHIAAGEAAAAESEAPEAGEEDQGGGEKAGGQVEQDGGGQAGQVVEVAEGGDEGREGQEHKLLSPGAREETWEATEEEPADEEPDT
jgi:hypothetical protein